MHFGVERMKQHYTDNDLKIVALETNTNNLLSTLNRIELSVRDVQLNIDKRFDKIENKIAKIEYSIDRLDGRLWFMCFFIVASYGSVIAALLKGFKLL